MVVRQFLLESCCELMHTLRHRGADAKLLQIFSKKTDYWEFMVLALDRDDLLFSIRRVFACTRFSLLYVALLSLQFVWLLHVDPRTCYKSTGRRRIKHVPRGNFSTSSDNRIPSQMLNPLVMLTDSSKMKKVECTNDVDSPCSA